jgi:hypothetical protein
MVDINAVTLIIEDLTDFVILVNSGIEFRRKK